MTIFGFPEDLLVTRREPNNTADLSLLKLEAKLDGQMCQVPPRFFNHSTLIGLTKTLLRTPPARMSFDEQTARAANTIAA